MKTLVLFFSIDGHNEKLASIVSEEIGADVEKIELLKPLPKGFFKYFIGGMLSALNKKPKIKPLKKDPYSYDLIIICTPVWASNIAAPFNTVLANYNLKGKKLVLFYTFAGSGENVFDSFTKKIPEGSTVLLEAGFSDSEMLNKDFYNKIKEILNKIK